MKKTRKDDDAKPGPRQQRIEATVEKAIKDIDDAAEAYIEMRDRRMRLTEKEHELRVALEERMRRHGKRAYRGGDLFVEIVGEEKAKVRRLHDESE